jgi:hypothetical protein
LTEEEQTLESVRLAEAEASRGTTARSSHVSSGLAFPVTSEALDALRALAQADGADGADNLVQLVIFFFLKKNFFCCFSRLSLMLLVLLFFLNPSFICRLPHLLVGPRDRLVAGLLKNASEFALL